MARRARRRDGLDIDEDTRDEDEESQEPDGSMVPDTSLSDLTQTADPAAFDQTFSDSDALLTLQGDFDPTAGPKQVIPRIGFTINFQMVWNPDLERWEPDEGNDGAGSVNDSTVLEKTSDQTITADNNPKIVTLQQAHIDSLGAANLPNNSIDIPEDGVYLLSGSVHYRQFDSGSDLDSNVSVNGSEQIGVDKTSPDVTSTSGHTNVLVRPADLSSGDSVQLRASADNTTDPNILGRPTETHLSVVRLA